MVKPSSNVSFKSILGIVLCGLVFGACIEHRPPREKQNDIDSKDESDAKLKINYDKVLVYKGTIPCADCSGIEQRLILKGDTIGIYRLTETYKNATEDGDAVLISTGHWKDSIFKGSTKKVLYLAQGGLQDTSRVMKYEKLQGSIQLLQLDGSKIESSSNYRLTLSKKNH